MTPAPPSEADVNAEIRRFEDRYGLFDAHIDGICLWQLIRFEVSILRQQNRRQQSPISRSRILRAISKGVWQFIRPTRQCLYLCKTYDSALREITPDGTIDIYFDHLCEQLAGGAKISSCNSAGFEQQLSAAARPPVFDDTSIIAISAILGRTIPFRRSHPLFDRLAATLQDEFKFHDYTPSTVRRHYNVFRWRVLLYKLLLRKFSPKVVIAPDSGQYALMKACSEMGARFVELQHGVFTSVHPNALPESLTGNRNIIRPTVLAAYGKFSRDVLAGTLLHAEHRIAPVGAAFIEPPRALRRNAVRPSDTIMITVTTQGIAAEQLSEFLVSALKQTSAKFLMKIKLHPAYDIEQAIYRATFGGDPRIEILSGKSTQSTHELIAASDLHLSISSASHYDALGIGTPTGIIALETHESVKDLLKYAGAFVVHNPIELAQILDKRAWCPVSPDTSNDLFEMNFVANMHRLIGPYHTDSREREPSQ